VTQMVQVALADDVAEAEEIQGILQAAGIESELETAVEHHPRAVEDAPQKVLVPESQLEQAQHAIESLTDPDDLIADA
jgi:Putative prokaryotic signal transducing protein